MRPLNDQKWVHKLLHVVGLFCDVWWFTCIVPDPNLDTSVAASHISVTYSHCSVIINMAVELCRYNLRSYLEMIADGGASHFIMWHCIK